MGQGHHWRKLYYWLTWYLKQSTKISRGVSSLYYICMLLLLNIHKYFVPPLHLVLGKSNCVQVRYYDKSRCTSPIIIVWSKINEFASFKLWNPVYACKLQTVPYLVLTSAQRQTQVSPTCRRPQQPIITTETSTSDPNIILLTWDS